ncbi:hypothetical protein KCU77_g8052, partial [Aureobasidium melanogenum]
MKGSVAQKKNVPNKRLAAILAKIIEDFDLMGTLDTQDNDQLQSDAIRETSQELTCLRFKLFDIVPPTLGPLEDERLEPYNRCWIIAKYVVYCQQMKVAAFETRFPVDGEFKDKNFTPGMTPTWMRQKKKTRDPEAIKSDAMKRADALSKKKFTVRYYARLNNPDSRDDLEENYEKAEAEGTDPLTNSCTSHKSVPDNIIFVDLSTAALSCLSIFAARANVVYQRMDTNGSSEESADLMIDPRQFIRAILEDELNDDFDFHIGVTARPFENNVNIFEFDVPPHLHSYFRPIGAGVPRDITATSTRFHGGKKA